MTVQAIRNFDPWTWLTPRPRNAAPLRARRGTQPCPPPLWPWLDAAQARLHNRGNVTLTVEDPRALDQLGERLGALMADLWLDGKLEL